MTWLIRLLLNKNKMLHQVLVVINALRAKNCSKSTQVTYTKDDFCAHKEKHTLCILWAKGCSSVANCKVKKLYLTEEQILPKFKS